MNGSPREEENDDFLNNIDYDKLISVIKKSFFWVIAILLFTNAIAFIYVRYTKPLYESTSDLKLDVKSDASILGLNNINEHQNFNNLSGEIELIKSRIFYNKVIDFLNLQTTYYTKGNVNDDERYNSSPFIVKDSLKSNVLYDQPIFVDILDNQTFILTYTVDEEEITGTYGFGETIRNEHFLFTFYLTKNYNPEVSNTSYYFIIHSEAALVNYLDKNLTVEPLNLNANTIRISFTDHNRYKARDLVNAIDSIYLRYTQEEMIKANKQKIDFLNTTLDQTEERLEAYENYFEDFTIGNKTIDLNADMSRSIMVMEQLDSQKLASKRELKYITGLEQQIGSKKLFVVNIPENIVGAEDLNTSLQELNALIDERELLLSSYKENTFAVRKKEQEVEILKTNIRGLLQEYQNQLENEISRVNRRKALLEQSFEQLPSKGTEYGKARRNFSLYEEFLLSLMQSKAEFEIARAGTVTDFKILAPATLSSEPIFPNTLIIYGIGIVSGFIFSFLFIGVRYLLHNKISSQSELEHLSIAPVLGVVPYYNSERMKTSKLVIDKSPRSAISEALRSIRTNMDFIRANNSNRIISVTSTISGEGKTFISVNLGAIIAMSKQKVIVVDMDMRRPKIHLAFSGENDNKGVSTVLINKFTAEECIRHSEVEGLDYLPAGPTPPNPSELILGEELDLLFETLRDKYDVIILDTPPVGLVTDGVLVMKKADLPIYVVRADYSRKSFIKILNRLIKMNKFKNISVLLNSLTHLHGRGYGYGYGHGNGYYEETPARKRTLAGLTNLFK